MPLTLAIDVPQLLKRIAASDADPLLVLRPDLDCRTEQLCAVKAFAAAVGGEDAMVVVPDDGTSVRFMLDGLFEQAGIKIGRKWTGEIGEAKASAWSLRQGGRLWVVSGRRPDFAAMPTRAVSYIAADRCEQIDTDISAAHRGRSRLLLSGALADRGHWFFALASAGECATETITLAQALTAFPDLAPAAEEYDATLAPRRLHCRDEVPVPVPPRPFAGFARDRLRIKTDKPLALLADQQRQVALQQPGATPVVPFYLSRLQQRYMALKRLAVKQGKRPWYLLLKYRRGGFTTLEQGLSYRLAVTTPRAEVATIAHHIAPTQRIFRIAKLMAESDPLGRRLVGDSRTALEFENGSSFFIGTAGGKGFARGDTLRRVHGSEVAKWCVGPRQSEMVEDLLAGLLGAASFGEVVLESTPNGREKFCQLYKEAKAGENDFTPIFLRWFDDPMNIAAEGTYDPDEVRETLSEREKALIEEHHLTLPHIAFRRTQVRMYRRLFLQEMPEDDESCFITSGTCYFDVDLLLAILESLPEDSGERTHVPGGHETRWKEPEPGHTYVAGCDTSEGLPGCDNSGLGVLDKKTGEQVCSLHGLFNPRQLATHAVRICRDYNDALLGIERENHGHAVIQRVVDLGYRKPHFRGGPLFYFDRRKDVKKARPGWSTNSATRPVMLEDLAEAVEEEAIIVNDRVFLDECLSFRLQSSGKFEADSGAKDDSVMKWAIAVQMRNTRRRKPRITLSS